MKKGINYGLCPKCGKKCQLTKHHLFNYYDIKRKLLKVYPIPKTGDEHYRFEKNIKSVHKEVPTVKICRICHNEIEWGEKPPRTRTWWT